MMQHPKAQEMDRRLQEIYEAVDREMELRHPGLFPLHPNRPGADTTASPQMDGLFNFGASFTPGYGSQTGRGYVVDLRISTLAEVPAAQRQELMSEALGLLNTALQREFPARNFRIVSDGPVWKILGDFSLGSL